MHNIYFWIRYYLQDVRPVRFLSRTLHEIESHYNSNKDDDDEDLFVVRVVLLKVRNIATNSFVFSTVCQKYKSRERENFSCVSLRLRAPTINSYHNTKVS